MEFEISTGLTHTESQKVTIETTASHYGSGLVEVYATPAMIALMEKAAMNAVLPHLPKGYNTVGIEISVRHTKATPLGMLVSSTAKLISVEGKKLVFSVNANDEEGEIGVGTHVRYIIDSEKFMSKFVNKI